jgi:dual 3',5'-cyclic-AMP and -GMP phosphodiesterase 11
VEAVLDENPDFFQDYLIRKASRPMIDAWLFAHALPPGSASASSLPPLSSGGNGDPTAELPLCRYDRLCCLVASRSVLNASHGTGLVHCCRLVFSSRSTSSGEATPVRKISAHEFEKGGLLKPLVTTIDGTPTFLSPPTSGNVELTGQIRKKSRTDMMTLNETELILELVKDICNDLDVRSLCHKILQNVGILTYADR